MVRKLTPEEHVELFERWCRNNPEVLEEMEDVARYINGKGGYLSSKYLIERQRAEGLAKPIPIKFTDADGNRRSFAISNIHSPLLARLFQHEHPEWRFRTQKSMFDAIVWNGSDIRGGIDDGGAEQ